MEKKRGRPPIAAEGTTPVMVRLPNAMYDEACRHAVNLSAFGRDAIEVRLRQLRNQISTSASNSSK